MIQARLLHRIKVEPDLCDLLNRLSIQRGWLKPVLHHRFKRCVLENSWTADKFWAGDLTILADFHFHHYCSGDMSGLGDRWIDQGNSLDELQRIELRLLNPSF